MSEEENIEYKSGDVVWVKLGSFWWPGEVTDQGPEDVTTSKSPVAIVKFFGEDNYEYVMNQRNIYPYNCERKHEFIKKGMDSYRGKNTQVEKFPLDINTAETKTDGNVNILFDIYSQQKKTNVVAEVFGTPTPKKSTKNGPHRYRFKKSSSIKKQKSSASRIAKGITHRRFLGCDDYEMRIRVQYPGKDAEPTDSDEDRVPLNEDDTKKFPCSTCGFITDRLEVMLFHVQCHIKGVVTPTTGIAKKKKSMKKPRKIIRDIELSDDDHTLSSIDSEEDIIKRKQKQKRKRKSQGSGKIKQKKITDEKSTVDIRTNLLAEWSDSEDIDQDTDTSKLNTSTDSVDDSKINQNNEKLSNETKKNDTKDESKSCFDFEEEDDDDSNSIVQTTISGRKIPRVIPANDRRKSTDPDNENASLPLAEDDETRIGHLNKANNNNNNESSSSNTMNDESNSIKDNSEFKDLMESTAVPELPDVPDKNNKTQTIPIKLPDKPKVDNSTEVATRLTNPKKRFVKSFEDFELLLNEQKKAMEEVELTIDKTDEKEDKSDKEQDVEQKKNKKEDSDKGEKLDKIKIIEKDEIKDKKIDVDIEELKIDKKEESENDEKQNKIESEKTVPEMETKLEISKLKCQIMSKITDEEQQQQQQQQQQRDSPKIKTKTSHRTPRSKILESYRNDTNEKKRRKSLEEKNDDLNETNKHPPKKSKYLRSNSDEKQQQQIEEDEEEEEKIEPKTDQEIIEDNQNKADEDKPIIETNKTTAVVEVEDKQIEKSDTSESIKETNENINSDDSIEINEKPLEKPIEKIDNNYERLFNLDDTKNDDEIIKSDKDFVEEKTEMDIKSDIDKQPTEDVSIKTNLSNEEEMSALTTLATVSQLQTTFDDNNKLEKTEIESIPTTSFDEQFLNKTTPKLPIESELVHIDGNLTVVSEKDLADGQVEITTDISPTNKKPVTLTTFSMDFSESINDSNVENVDSLKMIDESQTIENNDKKNDEDEVEDEGETGKTNESVIEIPPASNTSVLDEICDVEEHIPSSQIVCTQESGNSIKDEKMKTSEKNPSKLLERLTTISTTNTKDSLKSTKTKVQSLLTNEPKVPNISSKIIPTTTSIIMPTTSTTLTTKPLISKQLPTKIQSKVSSPKAIILSEQIIKSENPVIGENANTVSVQKISSKRNMQDPDEIDTFIIHKSKTISDEQNDDNDELNRKTKKNIIIDPKKQQTPISTTKKRGKAKILQQTIITPSGEIVQPGIPTTPNQTQNNDENIFDINSMPIVLSDQILTPESIENMPIFLSDSSQTTTEIITTPTTKLITSNIVKKPIIQQQQQQMKILNKTMIPSPVVGTVVDKTPKIVKTTKLVSPIGSKIIKSNSFAPGSSSKQGKFVIVSQGTTITSTPTTTSKYTVGKKPIIKRPSNEITGTLTKVQNVTSETSGNKIMILTNQQGQQQRVLLTPAQQKLMGYQTPGAKVTKTLVKGNIIQKTATPGSSGLLTKTFVQSPTTTQRIQAGQTLITSTGQVLTPISSKQVRIEKQQQQQPPTLQRKIPIQSQKVNIKGPPQQKTILIKNQHGQTVRKIQGTDEELLNQQVKEQIEAIKASGGLAQPQQQQQHKPEISYKGNSKTIRRSYAKKPIESPKITTKSIITSTSVSNNKTESAIPPLTPISPKKSEITTSVIGKDKVSIAQQQIDIKQAEQQQRPLNQLVIQDAMGNQTTITEGQILALPSETVDGQPQSYMLVTLDESGNLTPLNNEALMSLDPNLGLGADLGNTVLQIDQNALKDNQIQSENVEITKTTETVPTTITTKTSTETKVSEPTVETVQQQQQISTEPTSTALQTVNCSVSSDGNGGQQLIVTGDPVAAQKFLESLTEGNTDLANILMNAEGSILVHADGQQILINTDTDNQMLLSMAETSEGGGNPIFATQPTKNQDILAAALADTDVFQQDQNSQQGNVLETSLTLNSPIMTPLEVPSTNSKKITNENDILTQLPKNIDLPITITDPNISQTVAQQQVASLMAANELQTNLELTLPDTAISVTSSEMNSPSFVYSLPSLDESVDINQKPFNSSMPLLTEDTEDTTDTKIVEDSSKNDDVNQELEKSDETKDESKSIEETTTASTTSTPTTTTSSESITTTTSELTNTTSEPPTTTTTTTTTAATVANFLDDGLCSLGGEMCSSLSEPPPDMFDISVVLSDVKTDVIVPKIGENDNKQNEENNDKKDSITTDQSNSDKTTTTTSTTETTNSPNSMNEEDSCEIPVQPEIVTNLTGFSQDLEKNENTDEKNDKV